MPYIRERKIFVKAVQVLTSFGPLMVKAQRQIAAEALALIADSEDFSTNTRQHYDASDLPLMLECKEKVLSELMQDLDKRKLVRPLVDAIDKAKRQFGSKK